MGYIHNTRIGYHEVDKNRSLSLPSLIDIFQDTGGFHGADCGYSNKQLADKGLAWIVSTWQISVNDLPKLDDHVTVETYPFSFKFMLANRHYILRSPEGHVYVRANSLWVLMDMNKYAPFRIPVEMKEAYGQCEDKTDGFDFGNRKITVPEGGTCLDPISVDRYMIDTNGHVNNKEYVRIASCLLPENISWNYYHAEYTKQAKCGDILLPVLSTEKDRTVITLNNNENEQFFICEWTFR